MWKLSNILKKSLDQGIINKNRKHYKQVIKYTTLKLLRHSWQVLRGLCPILSAYFNKKEPKINNLAIASSRGKGQLKPRESREKKMIKMKAERLN